MKKNKRNSRVSKNASPKSPSNNSVISSYVSLRDLEKDLSRFRILTGTNLRDLKPKTETVFVTFYSFKGGVGRTMSLINTALLLAGIGRRVLMIDFDLEAPGLTWFAPTPKDHPGLVDLILSILNEPEKMLFAGKGDTFRPLKKFIQELTIPNHIKKINNGCLHLISSGSLDENYEKKLYSLNFTQLYEEGVGKPLFKRLKKLLKESGQYDYIFVDSRTGLSDEGGICTRDLADHILVFSSLNHQNIEGTQRFLHRLKDAGWNEGKLEVVISNVPSVYEGLRKTRFESAKLKISETGFFTKLNLVIPYHPRLSLDENPFDFEWSSTDLYPIYKAISDVVRSFAHDSLLSKIENFYLFLATQKYTEAYSLLREIGDEDNEKVVDIIELVTNSLDILGVEENEFFIYKMFDYWKEIEPDNLEVGVEFIEYLFGLYHSNHMTDTSDIWNEVKYYSELATKYNDKKYMSVFKYYAGNYYALEEDYLNACKQYFESCQIDSSNITCLFNLAVSYTHLNKIDQAVEAYLRVLERDPNYVYALVNLAQLNLEQDDADTALMYALRANNIEPRNEVALFVTAACYARKKEFDKSIAKLKEALKINPSDTALIFNLGTVYGMKEDYSKALEQFKKVLKLEPENFKASYYLAMTYGNLGDVENKIQTLHKLVSKDDKNLDALGALAQAYIDREEYQAAKRICRKILLFSPESDFATFWMGNISFIEKNYSDAAKFILKIFSKDSDDEFILETLVKCLVEIEDLETYTYVIKKIHHNESQLRLAQNIFCVRLTRKNKTLLVIKELEHLNSLIPDNTIIMMHLGEAYYDNGDYENALRYFQECLKLEPENDVFQVNTLALLLNLGEIKEVEKGIAKFLNKNPAHLQALVIGSSAYQNLGNFELALELCLKAIKVDHNFVPAQKQLAVLNFELKNYELAIKQIKSILEKDPKDLDLVLKLIAANFKLGEYDNAFGLLKDVLIKDASILEHLLQMEEVKGLEEDNRFVELLSSLKLK